MCQASRQVFFKNMGQEDPPIIPIIEIEGIPDGYSIEQAVTQGWITEELREVCWEQLHPVIITKVEEVRPSDPQHSAMFNQDPSYYKPMAQNEFVQPLEIQLLKYMPGMKIVREIIVIIAIEVPVEVTEYVFLDTDLELPAELVFKD